LPRPDRTLSGKRRIKKSREIIEVFKRGKRKETPYFSFLYRRNNLGYDRLAVVVNRKFGNAVKRNRAKRRIREVFRLLRRDRGYDIVIYLKPPARDVDFQELKKAFLSVLEGL